MCKLKPFVVVLMLVFVLGLAAPASYGGDILTPGITGNTESSAVTGDPEPPGVGETKMNGFMPTGGITGEIQFPGVVYVLAALFGISWTG